VSLSGRTISHYRIAEEISRGGMGVVYRATDTRLNRDIALKVLPPELMTDRDRRERFVREARAASALEHPHIAVIHDVGEEDGISFIAMELIRGDKLSAAIANGQFAANAGRALDIAIEIAEGLARAHSQGIVHRDLKPANVMLTDDGHAKVIDFGLAKLLAPLSGDSDTVSVGSTDPAVIIGTVSYMSPEQARSGSIDHRTDVFAFGVLLYEMFSGMVPFRGQSSIETIHAILHSQPAPLRAPSLAAAAAEDVQRIVDKCLAKDPEDRYQGMKDLIVDLKAARRRLDTASTPATAALPRVAVKRPASLLIGLASIAIVAAIGLWLWNTQRPIAEATGTRPSLAVLHFENNTGNPAMDWLRSGLADMLVTDLSQSTDVEVLSTDRLVQILRDLGKLEERTVDFDTVQELARRAHVKHVLIGSYVKAGEAIRINVRLQDAASGRIISTERVDAANEASLFPTMDDLTRRVKTRFVSTGGGLLTGLLTTPAPRPASMELDRDLKDVTTSSVEAYRYYAAGIEQHQRGRYLDALPLLEKATEVDPDFALAYVKMAVASGNVGRSNDRDVYAKKALDLVDRLTPRERYYIEGYYYSNDVYRSAQAIAAYEKAIALYPDHSASRNNLAVLLMRTDQYERAAEHFNILRDRGFEFPGAAGNRGAVYVALNRGDEAVRGLEDFVSRFPNVEAGALFLGLIHQATNRLDPARTALERTLQLRPEFPPALAALASNDILRDDFVRANERVRPLAAAKTQNIRYAAVPAPVLAAIYRGQTRVALQLLEKGAAEYGEDGSDESAGLRATMAELYVARGDRPAAVRTATRAVADARGRLNAIEALFQGSVARSAELRAEHQRLADALPFGSDKVSPLLADAVAATDEGDYRQALDLVGRVMPELPPGPIAATVVFPIRQARTVANYVTGRAQLGLGNTAAAAEHFQFVAEGGYWRLCTPIEYVRSLYYLGQIAERQGDTAKAREYYKRFLFYWKDGDIDRDKVAEAIKKTS
jgi:serine/threonine protein kinase/tetratricopeptide (TPR) repeat protein